jgi:hypothetical protein
MPTPEAKRHAPAALRNRTHILAVLESVLPASGEVLEIASGSGQHAVFFAEHLPQLTWQPSDPSSDALRSIDAWRAQSGLTNVLGALELDVTNWPWPVGQADAMVCINMIHIAPWEATLALMKGASELLPPRAPLITYGPYMRGGQHTAPSNAAFDESLRSRDPRWGVRDLDEVSKAAEDAGLSIEATHEMPANNFTIVFRRR